MEDFYEVSSELEIGGSYGGVLTYILSMTLKLHPTATVAELFNAVELWMQRDYSWLNQHPQLHTSTTNYNSQLFV